MVTFWLFWTVGIFNHLYCAYYSFNYHGFFNSTGFSANLMHKKRLSLSTNRLHKHTDNFKNMYQFCVLINTARLICSTNSQSGGEFRQFLSKESRAALPTLTHSAHFTWQQWGRRSICWDSTMNCQFVKWYGVCFEDRWFSGFYCLVLETLKIDARFARANKQSFSNSCSTLTDQYNFGVCSVEFKVGAFGVAFKVGKFRELLLKFDLSRRTTHFGANLIRNALLIWGATSALKNLHRTLPINNQLGWSAAPNSSLSCN